MDTYNGGVHGWSGVFRPSNNEANGCKRKQERLSE